MPQKLLLALTIALSMFAAGLGCQDKDSEVSGTASPQVELRVDAPEEVQLGDHVDLHLVLSNPAGSPVELTGLVPEYRYTLDVAKEDGSVVWSSQKLVTLRKNSWTIGPQSAITYDAVWDGLDKEGLPVAPGDYVIRGAVTLSDTLESPPVMITILP